MSSDNPALTLLVTGSCSEDEQKPDDEAADKVIQVFGAAAQKHPQSLLKSIRDAVEVRIDGMVMIALAILAAKSSDTFLKKDNTYATMVMLFSVYGPPKLLEFVELLKSKVFGRGFGARPQKWIKAVMEGWSLETLKSFTMKHPRELYSLTMLVHPRYHGVRGVLIRQFLGGL